MMTSTFKPVVFLPQNFDRLKRLLNRQYGDQELQDTAYVIVSTVMQADASIFGQEAQYRDIMVVSNLLTGLIAEYINEGLIDPEKISAYMKKVSQMTEEEWLAKTQRIVGIEDDELRAD